MEDPNSILASGIEVPPAEPALPRTGRWRFFAAANNGPAVSLINPQSWNRYGYVAGNPMSRTDPLGLQWNANICGSNPKQMCTGRGIDGGNPRAWGEFDVIAYALTPTGYTLGPMTLWAETTGGKIVTGNAATAAYLAGDTVWTDEFPSVALVYGNIGLLNTIGQSAANNGQTVPCQDQACELARAINKTGVQTLQNPCFVPAFYAASALSATSVALAGIGSESAVFPAFSDTLAGFGPAITTGTSWLQRAGRLGARALGAVAGAAASAISSVCQ